MRAVCFGLKSCSSIKAVLRRSFTEGPLCGVENMISIQLKRTLCLGFVFVFGLVALAVAGGFASQAIYCWATGNFDLLVATLAGFGLGFLVAGAEAAFGAGVTIGAALAGMAAAIGPLGWALIGAIIAGV